jgi:tetratricopeptide (TPR) repeat protein
LNPNSAAAHMSLGHLYFVTGRYDDARKELRTACRLQPTLEDAFYFLALIERHNNNIEQAAALAQRVVTLNPGNADGQFLLGQVLDKLGKADQAIEHWKRAVQADPNESQALYSLARALRKRNDPEAQQYQTRFDEVREREQVTDRVTMLRSFALQAAKAQNWPEAISQMQQAIQLCSHCLNAALLHKNLAFFYRSTGRIGDAEAELQQAIALDPNDDNARKALSSLRNLAAAQSHDR